MYDIVQHVMDPKNGERGVSERLFNVAGNSCAQVAITMLGDMHFGMVAIGNGKLYVIYSLYCTSEYLTCL